MDEYELMDIAADAGPDIPASCAGGGAGREGGTEGVGGGGGGQPALRHLAAGGHQPHMNSCIWHIGPQKTGKPQRPDSEAS